MCPAFPRSPRILSCAFWCRAGSRTMPPRPTSADWSSNCGLIRARITPLGVTNSKAFGKIKVREMKETSMTQRSIGSGMSARLRYRALSFSRTITRGSLRIFQASWPWPTSMAWTFFAPCWSRQSVNPPVDAPISRAINPFAGNLEMIERAFQFHPSAADVGRQAPGRKLRHPGSTFTEDLSTTASPTLTSPAIIARWACSRLAKNPFSTRKVSSRVFFGFAVKIAPGIDKK